MQKELIKLICQRPWALLPFGLIDVNNNISQIGQMWSINTKGEHIGNAFITSEMPIEARDFVVVYNGQTKLFRLFIQRFRSAGSQLFQRSEVYISVCFVRQVDFILGIQGVYDRCP